VEKKQDRVSHIEFAAMIDWLRSRRLREVGSYTALRTQLQKEFKRTFALSTVAKVCEAANLHCGDSRKGKGKAAFHCSYCGKKNTVGK